MFELVRKPCSLNFGMLGLFGMLLLAAVFACVVFEDGQFVAYGRNGTSAAYGRDGTSTAYGRDCTSAAYRRDCSSVRAEWWYERGAYYAGSSDFSRDWWSVLGSRTCGGRALGEWVVDLRHFTELCRSRGRTGSCIDASSQVPLGGAERFNPSPVAAPVAEARPEMIHPSPVATPVAEARPEAIQTDQGEDDTWGPWRAPKVAPLEDVASSEAQAQVAASSEAQDVRDVKRPRRGIPAGSRARVGAVPTPNESEEDLLKQVFQRELEVRRQEGEALGLRLRAEANEPLPLLSHFYGPPSPSQMYDSLALCLTDRSFLTRVALGGGGSSQDLVGGATRVSGRNRLSRPEEYGEETPYVPPRPPRFPEEEPQQRPQQKLLIDQATITENALEEWHTWLNKGGQTGQKLEGVGIDFFRRYYCRGISRRSPAAGGACERRSLVQRPSGAAAGRSKSLLRNTRPRSVPCFISRKL